MANKGMFGDRLSENKYNYLRDHVSEWYNDYTVVFVNNQWNRLFIVRYYEDTNTWNTYDILANESVETYNIASNNYRADVWRGIWTVGGNIYTYLYGANGYVDIDSFETLNLGISQGQVTRQDIKLEEVELNIFKDIDEVLGEDKIWNENPDYLNDLYIYDHSGQKFISSLLKRLLMYDNNENLIMTDTNHRRLANVILAKYANNWRRLYLTTQQNYNILDDYRKVDTHSGSDTRTDTPDNWKQTTTQTPTDWTTTVEGTETDNNGENENARYGFNSTDPVNVDKSTSKVNSKSEQTQTGTYETEVSHTGTMTNETEYGHVITTEGNLRNSPQELLEKERELWKYDFFNTVMVDLDRVLCLGIY